MKIANKFDDYELLGLSDGMKLERWGDVVLARPDPQIIWHDSSVDFSRADAFYRRSREGGGQWEIKNPKAAENKIVKFAFENSPKQDLKSQSFSLAAQPSPGSASVREMKLNLKLMGFKHTGIFPEQSFNWQFLHDLILKNSDCKIKVLNLFAYTGAASVACALAGADVTHVDSSRGAITMAKDNAKINGLAVDGEEGNKNLNGSIRFITDDCAKFIKRELRRGNKYDIILMDPPSFGRGAKGEVWNIERDLFPLVKDCVELLSENPLCFLINSYTGGLPKEVSENILKLAVLPKIEKILYETNSVFNSQASQDANSDKNVHFELLSDELGLYCKKSDLILPCGNFAKIVRV